VDRAARGGGGVDEVADLVGAEGDGEGRVDVRLRGLAGVDVDAGRGVDGHDRYAVLGGQLDGGESIRTQTGSPADADNAVDDDVGAGYVVS
jgi:hypothetical protein